MAPDPCGPRDGKHCVYRRYGKPTGVAAAVLAILGLSASAPDASETRRVIQAALDGTGHSWAYLEVEGRRAHLRGAAPSPEAAERVVAVVEETVCPGWLGSRSCTRGVSTEFDVEHVAWPELRVTVDRYVLTLAGRVPDAAMRWAILDQARNAVAEGHVRRFVDRLDLMGLAGPAGVDATAGRVAALAALCEAGEVSLVDGVISVDCRVPSALEAELRALAARPLLAGYLGDVRLTVAAE